MNDIVVTDGGSQPNGSVVNFLKSLRSGPTASTVPEISLPRTLAYLATKMPWSWI